MTFIYSLFVNIYAGLIRIAAPFNRKAKLRVKGTKETLTRLKKLENSPAIWMHCASLGEFEQGRTVLELLKEQYKDYKIVLSFFSSSGYEAAQNTPLADQVIYLPKDSGMNARRILKMADFKAVIWVKYEFWYYYLKEIHTQKIPLYLISANFRKGQHFFKPYGGFFRKILRCFSHIFVQNNHSKELLQSINIQNVTLAGDTRFDRVRKILHTRKQYPLIEAFKGNRKIFIAGSTWPEEEHMLFEYINKSDLLIKYIIAPHEIGQKHIRHLQKLSKKKALLYSEADENSVQDAHVLIIDNIGMLSSLYAYGDAAYIGGGFTSGIHNTLEAAVFGMPIIFGKKYKKFQEAVDLLSIGAAFLLEKPSPELLQSHLERVILHEDFHRICSERARKYVEENEGAAQKILETLNPALV